MKPFIFNPQPNQLADLFAQWLPMYVGQARMNDDEAEPFQDPLCELEKALWQQPILTMQDFFLHHAAGSYLGTMSLDYGQEVYDAIYAAALAETKEAESIQALIDEHIENEAKFAMLSDEHEAGSPGYVAAGGDVLSQNGLHLARAIASQPARSFAAITLKGRYLAARHERGELFAEEAFAFVASFLEQTEGV